MALLNPVDHVVPLASRAGIRLNWRLMLALAATLGFWVAVGEGVAHALHG